MLCPGSPGRDRQPRPECWLWTSPRARLLQQPPRPGAKAWGTGIPAPRLPAHTVDPAPLRGRAWAGRGCTQAAQPRPWLAEVVPAWEIFSPPHTQALSQVTKRPGHRTVGLFPGTHLHGPVLRGENADRAATIPRLVREGALICSDPAWTRGGRQPRHWSPEPGRESPPPELKMQQDKHSRERRASRAQAAPETV